MAFELIFPVETPGAEKLNSVEQIMSKLAGTTKLSAGELRTFEAAMKSGVAAGDSLSKTLGDIAKSQESFSREARAAATAILDESKAASAASVSVNQLKEAHRALVPEVAAAGAAIRTLEGQLSLRAVERFSTSVLGLGPILQAAFPIVGAIAFGETILRTFERMDPLIKAQKELAKSTEDLDHKYAQLGSRLERLQIQTITDKFGKLAGANLAAFYAESDLQSDKARIADLSRQIDLVKSKLASGGFGSAVPGLIGQLLTQRSEAAAGLKIQGLEDQRSFLESKTGVDRQQIDKDQADAAKESAREAARAAKEAAAEAKRAAREFASIIKALSGAGEGPLHRLSDNLERGNDLVGNDPEKREKLQTAFSTGFNREIADRVAKQNETRTQAQARLVQRSLEQSEAEGPVLAGRIESGEFSQFRKSLRPGQDDSALGNIFSLLPKRIGATSSDRLRTFDDEERQGVRQIQVGGGRGDELATAQKVAAFQTQAAQQRLELQLQIANSEQDATKKQEESQNAEIDYQRRLFDIRSGYEDKIIEKRKQNQEESVSAVVGLITAANGGASGISSFAKNFAQNLEQKVLTNVFDKVITPGQFKLPGAAGDLFKGTVFGSVPDSPEVTSRDKNTDAVNKLTATISGTTVDGASPVSSSGTAGSGGALPALGSATAGAGALADIAKGGTSGYGGLAGLLGGATHIGDVQGILTGVGAHETLSSTERLGAGIGTAGALYAGYRGVSAGLSQGGGGGTVKAIGAAAGTAAALDPEPISKSILAGVALASQVVSSLFGDPKQNRAQQQFKELGNSKYNTPLSISESVDGSGNYTDSDRFGNLRTSPFRGNPTISEPGQYYRNGVFEQVPGYASSPFQAGPAVQVNISTMDAKSFLDNSDKIGAAFAQHVTNNPASAAVTSLKYATGA